VSRLVSAAASLVGLLLFYRLDRRLAGPVAAWWSILTVRHPLDGGAGGSPASDGVLPDRTHAGLVRICEWSVAAGGGHGCDNRVAAPDQSQCDLSSPGVGAGGVVARSGPLAVSSKRAVRLALVAGRRGSSCRGRFCVAYAADPATFVKGWSKDMQAANAPGARDGGGRFALSPVSAEETLRYLGVFDPLLGWTVAGFCRAR
jgi:hypothetical protein